MLGKSGAFILTIDTSTDFLSFSDALERLTESGHIYNTVDEYHYQAST